jgi:hypothetical protein
MARQTLNVNTDAVINLTAKLERLNKSAFPSAVRSTLSDAAFEMKGKNIEESARKNMTVRNRTVFKKFTGVKKATGFDVKSMHSEVGFIPKDGIKGDKVPEGMERNEVGGTDTEGAMYLPKSRTSNSRNRLVRRKARFDKSNIAKGTKRRAKSKKLANVQNLFASFDEKAPTFIETSKGKFLVQVKSFKKKANGKLDIKLDFLMRNRKHNPAKTKATHFNKEAAIKTSKQIEAFYIKNATYQINKIWK